ncbi:hypothetical protein [Agrobacterium tumefaciens]|jgi:hypothetical protein|uniref:Uncharacterized protein n=1 Tax=Agrobacterium tumefaciens TaxID=358 RepID=A0A4D7YRK5_AGRTU|nr:hypothetical protein [Agrobacterium tumefaciens]QCL98247.1 hypothetical protein CFBP7129_29205 [Agrobacterium tumefaciens]
MNTIECTFRKIGSRGLVIFERDGILLRRSIPSRDFTLGDVNTIFVQILQQLRQKDIRFGFISDTRGMTVGTQGTPEFLALTRVLDDLLKVREVAPDFWMTWGTFRQARDDHSGTADAHTVFRAIEWYGVEKKEAILVCSTAEGRLAAVEAGITYMHYSPMEGGHHDHPIPGESSTSLSPGDHGAKWFNTGIERMLSLSLLRSARIVDEKELNGCGPDLSPGADEA